MQLSKNKKPITILNQELYDQHAPAILAYICQHISNIQDAKDLLMEIFLAALNRPGFSQLAFEYQSAWLRRVAHHKMVDRLRRMSRLTFVSLDEAIELESDEFTLEQQSVRRESYAALYRAIARLAPEQQMLLQLRSTRLMFSTLFLVYTGRPSFWIPPRAAIPCFFARQKGARHEHTPRPLYRQRSRCATG